MNRRAWLTAVVAAPLVALVAPILPKRYTAEDIRRWKDAIVNQRDGLGPYGGLRRYELGWSVRDLQWEKCDALLREVWSRNYRPGVENAARFAVDAL